MPRASTTSSPEPAEGQVPAGDYEPVPQLPAEVVYESASEEPTKTVNEIALEVISGYWGRGLKCKERLQKAGYDVAEVSEEVTRIFNR
jgi:CW_7 repeat